MSFLRFNFNTGKQKPSRNSNPKQFRIHASFQPVIAHIRVTTLLSSCFPSHSKVKFQAAANGNRAAVEPQIARARIVYHIRKNDKFKKPFVSIDFYNLPDPANQPKYDSFARSIDERNRRLLKPGLSRLNRRYRLQHNRWFDE